MVVVDRVAAGWAGTDATTVLLVSGNGDVVTPDDGVLAAGSGVGSAMAPEARTRRVALHMFAVIGMGFMVAAALWLAADVLLEPAITLRLTLVIMLILPLAWTMGRPFPWALRQFADQPRWIPWAWAINGFASVAAASLAPLISVHHGQPVTLTVGALCYVVALMVALRWTTAR